MTQIRAYLSGRLLSFGFHGAMVVFLFEGFGLKWFEAFAVHLFVWAALHDGRIIQRMLINDEELRVKLDRIGKRTDH